MKIRLLMSAMLMILSFCLWAQMQMDIHPVPAKRCFEKTYTVKQQYGEDKPVLATVQITQYDKTGFPKLKKRYLFNQMYLGKVVYQSVPAANIREELEYNSMNILTENRRWHQGATNADFDYTRYSGKGGIVEKIHSVNDSVAHQRKEAYYRELGYQTGESIYKLDAQNRDMEKHYYDYDGYNTLNAFYKYNENGSLAEVKEYAENDSLMQIITYGYTDAGNMADVAYVSQDGFMHKHEVYQYDNLDRITEYRLYENTRSFGGLEKLTQKKEYIYSDSNGKKTKTKSKEKKK